jgi:small RNA 2'-O-methyltransferase
MTLHRPADPRAELATSLHEERLEKVVRTLLERGAESVLDLGCGAGELLVRLATEARFKKLVGIDSSPATLDAARQLLAGEAGARITLHHASFTTVVDGLADFDAAVLVETIEHVDPQRLSAVELAVFAGYRPKIVLITTPNREYNVLHGLPEGALRHRDHRFEWTRAKFRTWSEGVARRHGYQVSFDDIGAVDAEFGSSTQMATFSRHRGQGSVQEDIQG